MSIYNNRTSKVYQDLKPTASEEPHEYRLKKLMEIEEYLLDENVFREGLVKRMKRFNEIISIVNRVSIGVFARGVGVPAGITLSGTILLLSLAVAITHKNLLKFLP